MELVKLGKKGQLTIPKDILRETGIAEQSPLMIEAAEDGSIVLRPVGVYPLESYSDKQVKAFVEASAITQAERSRVAAALKRRAK